MSIYVLLIASILTCTVADGVTYVRWGRTTCPTGASLVYEGITAGSRLDKYGGGANYICAVKRPLYLSGTTSHSSWKTHLYGTEYDTITTVLDYIENHNAPCAVCYVPKRSTKIMVPGTYGCPSYWTREYYGWLVASDEDLKARTEFVCLDRYPQVVPYMRHGQDIALFYHVASSNDGLPYYRLNRELSCAVCTR